MMFPSQKFFHPSWMPVAAVLLLFALSTASATAGDIATSPLYLANAVQPNVMLELDNSGSMANLIWADGYDPTKSYPDWGQSGYICEYYTYHHREYCNPVYLQGWNSNSTQITHNELSQGSCSSGYVEGYNGSTTKCLKIPNPLTNRTYPTRYYGNYLNYLFQNYTNATDLTQGQIPDQSRIEVARTVADDIVTRNTKIRFGLSSFNPPSYYDGGPGGSILDPVGSTTSDLTNTINSLEPEANTPLAETYYEITRYFRGMSPYQGDPSLESSAALNSQGNYKSPIQYVCQKNFVIVVTDGLPTYDETFPSSDPAYTATQKLPNWDNKAPPTTQTQVQTNSVPPYSDGFAPDSSYYQSEEGSSLYLDDLALFGHDLDLTPPSMQDNSGNYGKQNLTTYTVGFTTSNQMLEDAATYGDGEYFTANNSNQLSLALDKTISNIIARISSASAATTNTTSLSTGSTLYQARFFSGDWSGSLRALPLQSAGTPASAASWDAADQIPAPADRNIATFASTSPTGFYWNNLTQTEQNFLIDGDTSTVGQQRLNFLRGDRSQEAPNGPFRQRNATTVLGDIVDSNPLYVQDRNYGYANLPGNEGSTYYTYLSNEQSREGVLYIGANDGMLHAFDTSDGKEIFAYVPEALYPKLADLTSPNYNSAHQFYVDGSPSASDAYLNGSWGTYVLGSLGAGGRGIFALNVTDPSSLGPGSVMWELSVDQNGDVTPSDYSKLGYTQTNLGDLGYTIPGATIARMNNGEWVALVPNGYNSTSGTAALFIIDLATGKLIKEIDTGYTDGTSKDNGLSAVAPIDVDNNGTIDYIYAGDLQGNLWKFNVTSSNPNDWGVAYSQGNTAEPLFVACSDASSCNSTRQPITERPEVTRDGNGGYMVLFGTGKYFEVGDNTITSNEQTQSFYGIRDDPTSNGNGNGNGNSPPYPKSDLLEQDFITPTNGQVGNYSVRTSTANTISPTDDGWYIDFSITGERSVSAPILRNGRIVFTTLVPNTDPCGFGGDGYLMELDAFSGARLPYSPFDLNNDGIFDSQDYASIPASGSNNGNKTVSVPVSGIKTSVGIIQTPAVVSTSSYNKEFKYVSGSSGNIGTITENPGPHGSPRQSWLQLR